MSDRGAFFAVISGHVTGVGFRYSAMHEARSLGLTGYVKNEADRSVSVWVEGDRSALAEFRAWLEEGPPGARVQSVRADPRSPTGYYASFDVEF